MESPPEFNLWSLSLVMASDLDGQIDYLEQFGSSNVSIYCMLNDSTLGLCLSTTDLSLFKCIK